jgi:predicted chitinase
MSRAAFFSAIRTTVFAGHIAQAQVEGIEAILDAWQADPVNTDPRHLAYMLATVFHETATAMQPVRETLAASDDAAIAILDSAFRKGRLSQVREPYWRLDATGRSWLGRGLVQLTFRDNYVRLGAAIGMDLAADPALAMRMDVAVRILITGMGRGLFTGHKLGDYFHGTTTDWLHARKIINGLDRAEKIAGHARAFYTALGH